MDEADDEETPHEQTENLDDIDEREEVSFAKNKRGFDEEEGSTDLD
jgi:hypothetical protein